MSAETDAADDIAHFRATLDGVEHVVPWHAGEVLLDSMLDANLDPAFQCQQGHCGSCMVLKNRGLVEMRQNNVLSQRDLEQGYVLLCQSIPLSADGWVDCDQ